MKKVLLIDPPFPERPWDINWLTQFPPKGLMYIAAYLRQVGIPVAVYDLKQLQFDRPSLLKRSLEEIEYWAANLVRKDKPDVVGITSTTISYLPATRIARVVKAALPNVTVVIGGVHVTFTAHETLGECPWIDVVVRGEGERPMLAIAEGQPLEAIEGISFRSGDMVVDNPQGKWLAPEEIPVPAYDLLDMRRYAYVVLMCTRGCPHDCAFCELNEVHGRKIRYRLSDHIRKELDLAFSLNPDLEIRYEDEFMGRQLDRTRMVLQAVKQKKPKQFRAATRLDGINDGLLKMLKESGCSNLYVGVESGSDEVLAFNQRGITREGIRKAIDTFARNEMLFHAGFILGLPGETRATLEQSLEIALECCDVTFTIVKKYFDRLLEIMPYKLMVENSRAEFNLLAPNPGTPIFRNSEQFRYRILHKNWELYDCNTIVGEPYDLSGDEILEFKKMAFKAVQDKMRSYKLPVHWWDVGYKG